MIRSNMISLRIILDLFAWVGRRDKPYLLQSCQSLLLSNLVHNLAILQRENSCSRGIDLSPSIRLVKLANRKVIKLPAGVLAPSNPAAYHVVTLGNQRELVGVERNVRERLLLTQVLGLFRKGSCCFLTSRKSSIIFLAASLSRRGPCIG